MAMFRRCSCCSTVFKQQSHDQEVAGSKPARCFSLHLPLIVFFEQVPQRSQIEQICVIDDFPLGHILGQKKLDMPTKGKNLGCKGFLEFVHITCNIINAS